MLESLRRRLHLIAGVLLGAAFAPLAGAETYPSQTSVVERVELVESRAAFRFAAGTEPADGARNLWEAT